MIMADERKCIYCGASFDASLGEGDHVLMAGLFGEFEGDENFRGCCRRCNNSFSVHEKTLSQESPLGFWRRYLKVNLGRRAWRMTKQQGGVQHKMNLDGSWLLANTDAEDPRDATPFDQFSFKDETGTVHNVRLYPNMRAAQFSERVGAVDNEKCSPGSLFCGPENKDEFVALIQTAFPKFKIDSGEVLEAGARQVPGRVEFVLTTSYFQAIAKSAFHYFLVNNRRGFIGDEETFSGVRKFVTEGGEVDSIFQDRGGLFRFPFGKQTNGETIVPGVWCHVIAAHEGVGEIVVCLVLFAGPERDVPKPHYVRLGTLDGLDPLARDRAVVAHMYRYELERSDRYAGTRFPITPTIL
jgi:hypothetical protein